MPTLQSLYDINNRIYYHALFWVCYYLFRVMMYGDVKNTYENVAYVQAIELVLKISVVYFNLYYLRIKFFNTEKYFLYSFLLVLVICIATYIQLHVIMLCVNLGIYSPLAPEFVFSTKRFISAMGHMNWIVVITLSIKIIKDAYQASRMSAQLQQEKMEAELQFLKSQINPHFFFNTLNNLYSLIVQKSDNAGDVVLKLSDLMSYMIYNTRNDVVPLKKELEYIQNYIELEQLRHGQQIDLKITFEGIKEGQVVAPLMLIPFVENAFKHGMTKGSRENFLTLHFQVVDGLLNFTSVNSLATSTQNKMEIRSGIGLHNVRRRLELLYPDGHTLDIEHTHEHFKVVLTLELGGHIKL